MTFKKKLKMYNMIREVRDNLKYLVEPIVREDVRAERNTLQMVMDMLEEDGETK